MDIPLIGDLYSALAEAVKVSHEEVGLTASGHDADHDFEVGQLACIVAYTEDPHAAKLAGVAGLLHSVDRILERRLGLVKETISTASEDDVCRAVMEMISRFTKFGEEDAGRIVEAVIHHGSKPNKEGDDLVMIAVADADRLANMGANLPIRSGQHYPNLRILNPHTIEVDPSDRSPREKYNNPDSVLYDVQNAINWYRIADGPYALRLPRSREIGKVRAERLERVIQDIKDDRKLVGLYPDYPF